MVFFLFVLAALVIAVRQNTLLRIRAVSDISSYTYPNLKYGKGLIYYTENYLRNFNGYANYNLPAPDAKVGDLSAYYKQAQDCSRYLDLSDREIAYFKDLGVNFVILGFGPAAWYNLEPARDTYDFSVLDSWVNKLNSAGIRPVIQLWGTPTWSSGVASPRKANLGFVDGCIQGNDYTKSGNEFAPYNLPPGLDTDFANFASAVASHYDGTGGHPKVTDFSLWNEPNISSFWAGTSTRFVNMHNLAYSYIKKARPDSVVWGVNLLGNCCGADTFVNNTLNSLDFDILAIHAYPADFNSPPSVISTSTYSIGNFENIFAKLDVIPKHAGKSIVITEMGYRSNIEKNIFGDTTSTVTVDLNTKSNYLQLSLNKVNSVNMQGAYSNRVLGVANNVLYTPWRWWASGLINMYNPSTNTISFNSLEPSYTTFKNWRLNHAVPTSGVDSVYYDAVGGYTVIQGDQYWYRPAGNSGWYTNSLTSAYCNVACNGVPASGISSAYFGLFGSYTVIKGDRYWYRPSPSANWYTNTLYSAWYPGTNAATVIPPVPTSNVDAVYYDPKGNQTVVQGSYYWYRIGNTWITGTLASAYYRNSDGQAKGVPIENIDAAYFDKSGNYTVIKGSTYWYKANGSTSWYTNTLKSAYY